MYARSILVIKKKVKKTTYFFWLTFFLNLQRFAADIKQDRKKSHFVDHYLWQKQKQKKKRFLRLEIVSYNILHAVNVYYVNVISSFRLFFFLFLMS